MRSSLRFENRRVATKHFILQANRGPTDENNVECTLIVDNRLKVTVLLVDNVLLTRTEE